MILKKLTTIMLSLTVLALLTSAMMTDNGKAAKTGSPGELTCTDCHGDYAVNTGGGSISISGITGGTYTPGTTYNMSVVVSRTGSSLFGVGCEALTAANTNAGTLIITNASQTQLKSATVSGASRTSVVHQLNGGATSNTHTFTFDWTAPAAGTGNVTFYFAGAACNSDGAESGDYVYNSSLALTEGGGCLTPAQPGTITGTASVCSGSSQTYSISAVSGATDYIWTLPSGWTGSSTTTSITAVASSTSGNISVMAHNACGSSIARTFAVTASASVAPSISIAANPGSSICSGTSVTFTATPTNGGTTPAYQWKLNGANVGTNIVTYTNAALANSDVVNCVLTSNSTCASTPTATSNSITMTITSGSAPTVSIAAAPGNTVCTGSNVTFTATPTNEGTTPAYQWTLNGAIVGSNSATYSNSALVTGDQVQCVMTSNSTCASTATATSQVITMTVNSTFVPTISLSGSTTFCQGGNVILTASAGSSYSWSPGGETTQSITVTAAGTYSVSVSSGSCSGTSSSVTTIVNPAPVVTLSSISPVCSTDAAFPLTGGSPVGGTYSGNGVSAGNFDPATAGVGTTTITYTYSDVLACSASATTSVLVNNCGGGGCTTAPERPHRDQGPSSVTCGSTGVVYSVDPDTAVASYNWTVPADVVITANNGNSITVDFLSTFTNGSICVTATNACGTSPSHCFNLHQKQMHLSNIHGPHIICPSQLIAEYSIQPVNGAVSYVWNVGGGASYTSLANVATVDFTGVNSFMVPVSVQVTNACGQVRNKYMWVLLRPNCDNHDGDDGDDDGDGDGDGDDDHGHDGGKIAAATFSSEIFPNPNAGLFTVQLETALATDAEITLTDMIGKTQLVLVKHLSVGRNTIEMKATDLVRGIYFVKIAAPGMETKITRIVIQN